MCRRTKIVTGKREILMVTYSMRNLRLYRVTGKARVLKPLLSRLDFEFKKFSVSP